MTTAADRPFRAAVRGAVAGLAVLAAGCAGAPEPGARPVGAIASAAGESAAARQSERPKDAAGDAKTGDAKTVETPAGGPAAREAAIVLPPSPLPASPALALRDLPTLQELVGKREADVTDILGRPAFVRNDEPARLMQYRSPACVLDVFLYRDGDGFTVVHAEARGASVVRIAEPDCVLEVLKAKGAGASAG